MPQTSDSNFMGKAFEYSKKELSNTIGNLVKRVITLANKYGHHKLLVDSDLKLDLDQYQESYEILVEEFKFREALQEVKNIGYYLNSYLSDTKIWEKTVNLEDKRVVISTCVYGINKIAYLLFPFLPSLATKLNNQLGKPDIFWDQSYPENLDPNPDNLINL
jgi:methionyl-tRNA synthetase